MKEQDDLVAWLEARVPRKVPAELSTSIRATIVAKLSEIAPEPSIHSESGADSVDRVNCYKPSLEMITVALIFICLGLNVVVGWSSDYRIQALVGDDSEQYFNGTRPPATDQLTIKDFGNSTAFEINISLIQQELNHEQHKLYKSNTLSRQYKTISPSEKKTLEESLDPAGTATEPRIRIQRFSKLAGKFTA